MEERILFICISCNLEVANSFMFRGYVILAVITLLNMVVGMVSTLNDFKFDFGTNFWIFELVMIIVLIASIISIVLIIYEKQENILFFIAPMIPIILFMAVSIWAIFTTFGYIIIVTIPVMLIFMSIYYLHYRIYCVKKKSQNYTIPIFN